MTIIEVMWYIDGFQAGSGSWPIPRNEIQAIFLRYAMQHDMLMRDELDGVVYFYESDVYDFCKSMATEAGRATILS